jgi:hypothetical protein
MSLRAMLWALHDAPVSDALSKLILLALADAYNDETRVVYLGQQAIADTVPCSRPTVQRHLRELESSGLLVRSEDQSATAWLRADRRPVVYTLPIRGITVMPRPELRGITDDVTTHQRGITGDARTKEPKQEPTRARSAVNGAPLGCASHSERRPACADCMRVNPIPNHKPARAETVRALVTATRAGIDRDRERART